jgi:hypothetical protein
MTARTAYGLETPRGAHWADRAACGSPKVDPEWWWPVEHGAPTAYTRLAVHICRQHCAVRVDCERDAYEEPPRYPVVVGGMRFVSEGGSGRGRVRPAALVESDACTGCPYCAGEAS